MNMHSHIQLSAWTTKEEDINIPAHTLQCGHRRVHSNRHTHKNILQKLKLNALNMQLFLC